MCNSQEERPSLGQPHYSRFLLNDPGQQTPSTGAMQKQSGSFCSPPQKLQMCRAAFEQSSVEHPQSWFWDTHSSYPQQMLYSIHSTPWRPQPDSPTSPTMHFPQMKFRENLKETWKTKNAEHCVSYLEEQGVGRESPNKTDCSLCLP